MVTVVVFTGLAGSGKTSLVASYGNWLREALLQRVAQVNLDPGVEVLPYKPVFDVRDLFTLSEIMRTYGLGPNGGFIKAGELIAERSSEIFLREPFSNLSEWDYVLIDTPGQMDAFIFRPAGNIFLEALTRIVNAVNIYVIDSTAIRSLADALTIWLLGLLTHLKIGLQTVPVVNKVDVVSNGAKYVRLLVEEPGKLIELSKEGFREGLLSDITIELAEIAFKLQRPLRPIEVSAKSLSGIELLHSIVHEVFCSCGDLT
ncbi:MAG: ATP/GTP-binding protein [Sulfolobales archaeon]|nr:ATP/GTP-binding protein [Sulfolobales archaeon]MCX8199103.1 ATP/GTP-binding protein [Sulfolobales archaeon]MDW8170082.1 ATP/GTP-binding protein [Desulfurococcaceae archaeon]